MSFQIENSLKVAVSAALAAVLTLIVMTGIGGASSQEISRQAAFQTPAAGLSVHAG